MLLLWRLLRLKVVFCITLCALSVSEFFVLGWYDTTTPKHAIYHYMGDDVGPEHNPEIGTMVMHKRKRNHVDSLALINMVSTHQARHSDELVAARNEHADKGRPVIGRVTPMSGPLTGNTKVIVEGTKFSGGSVYKCKFGDIPVPAVYKVDTGEIECLSPAIQSVDNRLDKGFDAKFSIAIFFNEENKVHHTASSTHKFRYYNALTENPKIIHLEPISGPATGGTVVTVKGLHLTKRLNYSCKFGSELVPAIFAQSPDKLEASVVCISPKYYRPKLVAFHVLISEINTEETNNSGMSNRLTFQYYVFFIRKLYI